MRKLFTGLAAMLLFLANAPLLLAQSSFITTDTIHHGTYTLVFINKAPSFNAVVKQRMQDIFFAVYPRLAEKYNAHTLRSVTFIIDPDYKGVAATSGGEISYNPGWLHQHPGDVDVVTHEIMHVVQAYPNGAGPGWLTEGIADYVRYAFGVDNEGAGWKLPEYAPAQHYNQSYRVTARFLLWLEKTVKPDVVKALDASMRAKKYTPELWHTLTGKTLHALWSDYAQDPRISL